VAVGSNAQLDTCEGCLASVGVLADHSASEEGIAVRIISCRVARSKK